MAANMLGTPAAIVTILMLSFSLQLSAEATQPSVADQNQIKRSIQSYLDRLDELEEQYGAYEPELGEELAGLGTLYQANGQHLEAVAVFKRQYQIARTNDGLFSLSQADTLRKMIVSLNALREWEEVEKRHFFLQQLIARNYPPNDMRRVPSLQDMANWHLYAFNQNIDQNRITHLLSARNALAETGGILSANGASSLEKLDEIYSTLLYTDYQIAIVEQESIAQAQSRAAFEQRVRNDFYYNNQNGYERSRNLRTAPNSFLYGVRHLEDLRNAYANNPAAPAGSVAGVNARIGDWYALWLKQNTANRFYQKAWNDLVSNPEILEETFGSPVRLLNFVDKYESSKALRPGMKQGYVVFSVSINADGRVKNISILENKPADRTQEIARAGQRISRSRYRPRYEDGVPVQTDNFQVRYAFEYEPYDTSE